MAEVDDIGYNSDEEINRKHHSRLLEEVLQLDKRQFVKKPSRTEPTTHVSEFTLVKPSSGRRNTINVNDLAKSLKQKDKHVLISRKIKSVQTKAKPLHKPLEKPQAERIRRSLGFTKAKDELMKWNSIVDKNRVAAQLIFPLNQDELDFDKGKKRKSLPARYKSELDRELEKLEPVVETVVVEDKFPLSMEEILERRKEMAKLRARQSYQEAKAYKKSKIKSKTYHKVQRKERIKQQIKEFELLRTTDPEEALRKLEELEKTRAEERMSLRHRSTGQWARNKQVRAKYDKDSRQALVQQLSISRELTQKMKASDETDSENDEPAPKRAADDSNPWVANRSTELEEFVSGYRKFWNEQNNKTDDTNKNEEEQSDDDYDTTEKLDEFISLEQTSDHEKLDKNSQPEKQYVKNKQKESTENKKQNIETKTKKSKSKSVSFCNSAWEVTPLVSATNSNVEDMFENLEDKARSKAQQKINNLKNITNGNTPKESKQKLKGTKKSPKQKLKSDLTFPREKMRPEIDEELGVKENENENLPKKLQKTIKNGSKPETNTTKKQSSNTNIDPNKYMSVQPVNLDTQLPDVVFADDNEEEGNDQRAFITEAFEDDDVVEDFSKEKKNIIDENKPKNIDLSLPGWGSWGGKNIKPSKRKKRRFIVRMPKEMPRKDENRGNLIINEDKDVQIKKHQVSDVPFPFTKVKEFEASIRAPIGETFVPQTAFRRLIKPPLITKKGTIIEPMSQEILLKQKFSNNGMLVNK